VRRSARLAVRVPATPPVIDGSATSAAAGLIAPAPERRPGRSRDTLARHSASRGAHDRSHRIGQTRNVVVYRLISADTIEEKVMELKARKAELFSSVIDSGNMFGRAMTAADIRELFT
jgi:hypothetical protein